MARLLLYFTNMKYSFQHRASSSKNISDLCNQYTLFVFAVFALLLFFPSLSSARLSGDASLTYIDYNGSSDSRTVAGRRNSLSSTSLVQNYSLLYSSNGPVYNSRVGYYDVALGYNWSALDTSFKSSIFETSRDQPNDENYNKTRGHLMYKGEINLDPKELPIKFNAYSRDMTRNVIANNSGNSMPSYGSVIGFRDQPTDISEGLHTESGVTLVAGVKSGMSNGFNEILRLFPMVLVDYKDVINRDLQSTSKTDNRLRRLAFVSLNKKDNWFHYRHTLYEDYQDKDRLNDYYEDEIQLGTVDQYMARRWIDFSNWLKVSTDLSFSKRKSNYQANPIEDINLNMFVTGERQYWNARMLTTFNRYKDDANKLFYKTTLPLYLSGVVSQDTSWNTRTSFRNNKDIDASGARSDFINTLVGYRVDSFKRAPFTLSQSLDVEATKTISSTGSSNFTTLSGSLETASTTSFSRSVALGASYNIKNSLSSNDTGSSSDFIEHTLNMVGTYSATNTLRFEMRQRDVFTTGTLKSPNNGTESALSVYVNPRNLTSSESGTGDSLNSISSLTASWDPKARLNTYISLIEDIYKTKKVGTNAVTQVISGASFVSDVWGINNTFKYTRGSRDYSEKSLESISNAASLRYTHSRTFDISLGVTYLEDSVVREGIENSIWTLTSSSSRTINYEQRLNYNIFTQTGITRKLLEFNETLVYGESTDASNISNRSLVLGFRYYPIQQLILGGGAGYAIVDRFKNDYTLVWNTSLAANFRLMQVSLDYVSGIKKIGNIRENMFTGNIRKSF